jgi:ABC-type dipeptide/oligopeptide/nickel transport system permease component
MGRYVARRLLQMIPVFLGTTLLIFLMVYALPGDPIRALWGEKAADPVALAALRHKYGLDLPMWHQYWNFTR